MSSQQPNLLTPIGGRRFVLAVGCGLVNTILVAAGVITPEVYQWIILGTVAAYITGSTTQQTWGPGDNQNGR